MELRLLLSTFRWEQCPLQINVKKTIKHMEYAVIHQWRSNSEGQDNSGNTEGNERTDAMLSWTSSQSLSVKVSNRYNNLYDVRLKIRMCLNRS